MFDFPIFPWSIYFAFAVIVIAGIVLIAGIFSWLHRENRKTDLEVMSLVQCLIPLLFAAVATWWFTVTFGDAVALKRLESDQIVRIDVFHTNREQYRHPRGKADSSIANPDLVARLVSGFRKCKSVKSKRYSPKKVVVLSFVSKNKPKEQRSWIAVYREVYKETPERQLTKIMNLGTFECKSIESLVATKIWPRLKESSDPNKQLDSKNRKK